MNLDLDQVMEIIGDRARVLRTKAHEATDSNDRTMYLLGCVELQDTARDIFIKNDGEFPVWKDIYNDYFS